MSATATDQRPAADRRPSGRDPATERGGPMHASLSLGRIAGIEIGINWSWLVIFGLITWSLGAAVFPDSNPGLGDGVYAAMAGVAAILFFTSLLLHELGHAVVAKREGMEIEGIVLWMFGGVAQFKGLFPSAGAELRIALAGPAVSLAIGLGLLAAASALPLPEAVDGVTWWLGSINLFLLAFNMLPALPLDGGRVLRAILWHYTGDFTRATAIAGALGKGFGQVLIFGGILGLFLAGAIGGLWFALIGWFLIAAASAETRFATIRAALGDMRVEEAMAAHPLVAESVMTLAEFSDTVFSRSRHAAYPVVEDGWPTGILGFRSLAAVPPASWERTTVGEIATSIDSTLVLAPEDDLGLAAMELAADRLGRALVVDADGRLAGLLSMTDVSRLIELRSGNPKPRQTALTG